MDYFFVKKLKIYAGHVGISFSYEFRQYRTHDLQVKSLLRYLSAPRAPDVQTDTSLGPSMTSYMTKSPVFVTYGHAWMGSSSVWAKDREFCNHKRITIKQQNGVTSKGGLAVWANLVYASDGNKLTQLLIRVLTTREKWYEYPSKGHEQTQSRWIKSCYKSFAVHSSWIRSWWIS